jgi:hypothetical protein
LAKNEIVKIAELIWELVKYNPGIGLGTVEFKKSWAETVEKLCDKRDFGISSDETELRNRIISISLIQYLSAKNHGISALLNNHGPDEMLVSLALYGNTGNFSDEDIQKTNKELRKNKKEYPAWEEVRLIDKKMILDRQSALDEIKALSFPKWIKTLGTFEAVAVYRLLKKLKNDKVGSLDSCIDYSLRTCGVDSVYLSKLASDSEFFEVKTDFQTTLGQYTKDELLEICTVKNLEITKSKKKELFIIDMISSGKISENEVTPKFLALSLKEAYSREADVFLKNCEDLQENARALCCKIG